MTELEIFEVWPRRPASPVDCHAGGDVVVVARGDEAPDAAPAPLVHLGRRAPGLGERRRGARRVRGAQGRVERREVDAPGLGALLRERVLALEARVAPPLEPEPLVDLPRDGRAQFVGAARALELAVDRASHGVDGLALEELLRVRELALEGHERRLGRRARRVRRLALVVVAAPARRGRGRARALERARRLGRLARDAAPDLEVLREGRVVVADVAREAGPAPGAVAVVAAEQRACAARGGVTRVARRGGDAGRAPPSPHQAQASSPSSSSSASWQTPQHATASAGDSRGWAKQGTQSGMRTAQTVQRTSPAGCAGAAGAAGAVAGRGGACGDGAAGVGARGEHSRAVSMLSQPAAPAQKRHSLWHRPRAASALRRVVPPARRASRAP